MDKFCSEIFFGPTFKCLQNCSYASSHVDFWFPKAFNLWLQCFQSLARPGFVELGHVIFPSLFTKWVWCDGACPRETARRFFLSTPGSAGVAYKSTFFDWARAPWENETLRRGVWFFHGRKS